MRETTHPPTSCERLEALCKVSQTFAEAGLDRNAALNLIARTIAEALGDGCGIGLLSDDGRFIDAAAFVHRDPAITEAIRKNLPMKRIRVGEGYSRQVVEEGRSVLVPLLNEDTINHLVRPQLAIFLRRYGIRSMIIVPIRVQQNVIGALGAVRASSAYTAEDESFIQLIADHVALGIVNTRLDSRLRRELDEHRKTHEEKERLVSVLETTQDFVGMMDPFNGRILYINPAGRMMLRIQQDEDLSAMAVEQLHTEESRRTLLESIPIVMREGTRSTEVVFLARDGREIPVWLVATAHKGADGTVKYLSCIARDLTKQKKLEQQYRQSQKMEALGQLAGGVAHDFNNMLTVILGHSRMTLEGMHTDEPLYKVFKGIEQAAERSARLTRQLLAFSRRQIIQPRPVCLNSIIGEMQDMLARVIREDVALVTFLRADAGTVRIDPGQMEQVIMNLVVNARDAMPKGGKLTIETANVDFDVEYANGNSRIPKGSYVMIDVTDTGIGMDRTTMAQIFDPFFTTKPEGKGTGLGLATVYGIIQQNAGAIAVYSEPGKGTTFKIYLPRIGKGEIREGAQIPEPVQFKTRSGEKGLATGVRRCE